MISSNSYYISGREKFERKDFRGALADYNRAIEQEENPAVYSERAVVYFYLKELDLSLADMDHAAGLEPENPYRYSSRAYIRDAMGDVEGAIEDYLRAIELDPEDSIAHNNLGLLQEKLGYRDKASRSFSRADTLAQVDELLKEIRKEKGWSPPRAELLEPQKLSIDDPIEARDEISLLALLRNTFTTRSGFREYIQFIINGFKT